MVLAWEVQMLFGVSLSVYLAIASALILGIIIGRCLPNHDLPPLSYRRLLKPGTYRVNNNGQITGREYNGHAIDTSYVTLLKCPDGKFRLFRFEERCLGHMIVGESGDIQEADLAYN